MAFNCAFLSAMMSSLISSYLLLSPLGVTLEVIAGAATEEPLCAVEIAEPVVVVLLQVGVGWRGGLGDM